ncbi:MAG: TerB family tellurite resistance protein [Alphaproteobacteria bacterium]
MNQKYSDLPFYNMKVSFLDNGRMHIEEAAIKNIWKKGESTFFDLYIYSKKKSQVLDMFYIRSISNLNSNKIYANAHEVIEEFIHSQSEKQPETKEENKNIPRSLKEFQDDIIILSFIATCDGKLLPIKIKAIEDYIIALKPEAKILSESYIRNYISTLNPSEEDFYGALNNIQSKTPEEALKLVKEAMKIATSDGFFDYHEKFYVAELIQILREFGISLKTDV